MLRLQKDTGKAPFESALYLAKGVGEVNTGRRVVKLLILKKNIVLHEGFDRLFSERLKANASQLPRGRNLKRKPVPPSAPSRKITVFSLAAAQIKKVSLSRDAYSAATNSSARANSTDSNCDTPCSAMVTPNKRSMRLMVTGLWVMAMNLVLVRRFISSSTSQ